MDPTIIALIAAFERQDDVTGLQDDVTQNFNKLVLENKDFNVYFSSVLPDAITNWAARYKKTEEKEAKEAEKEEAKQKKEEAKKQEEKETDTAENDDSKEENKEQSTATAKEDNSDSEEKTVETIITTDKVNIRQKASQDSSVLGQASKGTKFTRYKEKGGWSKVKYKNKTAWISSDYVKVEETKQSESEAKATASKAKQDESEDKDTASKTKKDKSKDKATKTNETKTTSEEKTTSEKTVTVYTTDKVNVRKDSSQNSDSLGQVSKGTKLTRYTEKDGWSQIEYKGSKAWIRSDFLTTEKSGEEKQDTADEPEQDNSSGLSQGQRVRLSSAVNIRKSMSETADRVGVAYSGDTVTVEAVYQDGWTKVDFNGKEGYIKTEYLK